MNFKKFLTGLALVGLVGVAGLTSAYYPGNDGFDVPTYGNATLVNSLTVGGNAMITDDTVSGDYLNVNTTDDCTVGRININACVTNSVNPVVNVGGSLVGAAANNYHVFSDSRDVNLAAGTAANSYDCRGSGSGSATIDHFACFQASWNYNGTGTVNDYFALYTTGTITNASGHVVNGYGLYVAGSSPGLGTLDNSIGIYIAELNSSNTPYAIYQVGQDDIVRFDGDIGIGQDPVANHGMDIRSTHVLGTWLSGLWVNGATYPTVRLRATTADLWSGLGNNADGSLHFLVGGVGSTGTPVDAGGIYATGGLVLGVATSGDKGLGTINVATNIYKNNTAYTNPDYVFEHYFNNGRIVKFAKNDGAKEYRGLAPLKDVRIFVEKHNVLPRLFDAREKARKDKKAKGAIGLFDGGDAVLASIEEAYLYLFKHEARITQHDQEILALRKEITELQRQVKILSTPTVRK